MKIAHNPFALIIVTEKVNALKVSANASRAPPELTAPNKHVLETALIMENASTEPAIVNLDLLVLHAKKKIASTTALTMEYAKVVISVTAS